MPDDPKPDDSTPPRKNESSREFHDEQQRCDYCGSTALVWRRCKLICENCRGIVLSCGDL
jgi:hypothetical protein